jgi:hypothetical protein
MLGFALPGASAWEEATEFAERSGLLAIPCFPCLRSSKPSPSWRTFAIGSSANASPSPVDRHHSFLSLPHQASSTNWSFWYAGGGRGCLVGKPEVVLVGRRFPDVPTSG